VLWRSTEQTQYNRAKLRDLEPCLHYIPWLHGNCSHCFTLWSFCISWRLLFCARRLDAEDQRNM